MDTRFTWDPVKARRNRRVHCISFEMAREAFADPHHIVTENYLFPNEGEQRYLAIGMTRNLVLVVVVFVDRSQPGAEIIHIISARKAVAYEGKHLPRPDPLKSAAEPVRCTSSGIGLSTNPTCLNCRPGNGRRAWLASTIGRLNLKSPFAWITMCWPGSNPVGRGISAASIESCASGWRANNTEHARRCA